MRQIKVIDTTFRDAHQSLWAAGPMVTEYAFRQSLASLIEKLGQRDRTHVFIRKDDLRLEIRS